MVSSLFEITCFRASSSSVPLGFTSITTAAMRALNWSFRSYCPSPLNLLLPVASTSTTGVESPLRELHLQQVAQRWELRQLPLID